MFHSNAKESVCLNMIYLCFLIQKFNIFNLNWEVDKEKCMSEYWFKEPTVTVLSLVASNQKGVVMIMSIDEYSERLVMKVLSLYTTIISAITVVS